MSIIDFFIPPASAHEKWFVDPSFVQPAPSSGWDFRSSVGFVALAVIAGVTVAAKTADVKFSKTAFAQRVEARLRPLRDLAPGVLAVSTGLLLLSSALRGVLLADNFPFPSGPAGQALLIIEAVCAGLFLIGLFTPIAAGLLLALFSATFVYVPATEPFDYIYFIGIAYFLFFFSRGRYSMDWFLGKPMYSSEIDRKHAFIVLRLFTGVGFLVLAFSKWLHPELHMALMDRYATWNPYVILQTVGIHLSRQAYVFMLGAFESLAALFILLGAFTRYAALGLMPLFVASIVFLGPMELIGHLPILGILFVLFVFGDGYHRQSRTKNS